jgi:thiol:disulfide interchange protein DsbD
MAFASTQDQTTGMALMCTVGLGMGFPYFALSAVPEIARHFPRTGPLANLVKQMLGFSLVAIAAYFAGGRFIAAPKHWWILVPIAGIASVFLLVRTFQISRKPVAILVSLLVAVVLTGSSYGIAKRFNASTVNWIAFTDSDVTHAKYSGKPVLIEFTASWCLNCQYIEGTVFHDKDVIELLSRKNIQLFKADITKDSAPGNAALKQLVPEGGVPTTVIYPPNQLKPILLEGIYTSQTLIDALNSF